MATAQFIYVSNIGRCQSTITAIRSITCHKKIHVTHVSRCYRESNTDHPSTWQLQHFPSQIVLLARCDPGVLSVITLHLEQSAGPSVATFFPHCCSLSWNVGKWLKATHFRTIRIWASSCCTRLHFGKERPIHSISPVISYTLVLHLGLVATAQNLGFHPPLSFHQFFLLGNPPGIWTMHQRWHCSSLVDSGSWSYIYLTGPPIVVPMLPVLPSVVRPEGYCLSEARTQSR